MRLLVVALATLLTAGCEKRIESSQLQSDHCPMVSVATVGRMINFYSVVIDIEGHGSYEIVPNIDMPGDESRYIVGLRPSSSGVDVIISEPGLVRDLDLQISPKCKLRTVGSNMSFKPTLLRKAA